MSYTLKMTALNIQKRNELKQINIETQRKTKVLDALRGEFKRLQVSEYTTTMIRRKAELRSIDKTRVLQPV